MQETLLRRRQDPACVAMAATANGAGATILDGVLAPQLAIGGMTEDGVRLMAQTIRGSHEQRQIPQQRRLHCYPAVHPRS